MAYRTLHSLIFKMGHSKSSFRVVVLAVALFCVTEGRPRQKDYRYSSLHTTAMIGNTNGGIQSSLEPRNSNADHVSLARGGDVGTEKALDTIIKMLRNKAGLIHERNTNPHKRRGNNLKLRQNERNNGYQHWKFDAVTVRQRRQAKPEGPAPQSGPMISTPEPEGTKTGNSEPEPHAESSWPEPGPNWPMAFKEWSWAWALHVYGFAATFAFLTLLAAVEIFRLVTAKRRKATLKVTILGTIAVFCVTRSIALFSNPYGSTGDLDAALTRLLFAIGNPCAISALSLLLLVLIDTTKMNVAPPKFQRVQYIIPVIIVHVILVIATDFIVAYYLTAKDMILACQLYYIIVGLFLTVGFAKVAYKISGNVAANVHRDLKMRKLQRMITVLAVISFTLIIVHLYAAVGVFGIYSHVKYVDAWSWWAFQTSKRLLEVVMCVVLITLNSNTVTNRRSLLRLLPCCHGNKVTPISTNTNNLVNFEHSFSATNSDMKHPHKAAYSSSLDVRLQSDL